jgi:dihydrodipicolinate synthase/N-acetylneuraminate lyase
MTDVAIGKVAAVLSATEITVLAGEDSVLWHQINAGAEGAMTAIPMIYPETSARMWQLFRSGAISDAFVEYQKLAPFITVGIHGDDYVAAVKTVLQQQGVLESDEVRLPLVALSAERRAEVLAALRAARRSVTTTDASRPERSLSSTAVWEANCRRGASQRATRPGRESSRWRIPA